MALRVAEIAGGAARAGLEEAPFPAGMAQRLKSQSSTVSTTLMSSDVASGR
jgi:hypothetical protein